MISKPFQIIVKELCEEVLSVTDPKTLSQNIINHVQKTFSVEWSTLWLTEQKGAEQKSSKGDKQLKIAAASEKAKPLLEAEDGNPAVYDFGEGLTGNIAATKKKVMRNTPVEIGKPPHSGKYDKVMYAQEKAGDLCRCVLGVPLLLRSPENIEELRVIGVIKLENRIPKNALFTESDSSILEAYAAIIAVALEKAQMREDSLRIGKGLLEISQNLLESLGGKPNLTQIVEKTANVISAEASSLWIRYGTQLRLEATYGYPGSTQDVPPYNIQVKNENYDGKGLTVFVANKKKSLNLKSMEEIREHPAWRGANDARMWNKQQGYACYSLVAIPLIDNDTEDVKGVFKIENKLKTIFQLENYFTSMDQQLLTILGNSICLSLIISERVKRLTRLEKLVSKIRVLSSLEEALFFILTGLTHGGGLEYNRALIFLSEEKPNAKKDLVCRFAIGPLDDNEWQEITENQPNLDENEFEKDLDNTLCFFNKDRKRFYENKIMKKWFGVSIPIDDKEQVIAHHARTESRTKKYLSGNLSYPDKLNEFARGDYILIPIRQNNELLGIIYADNKLTGNPISLFECDVLDIFSGMAAAVIQASKVPERLKRKSEEAWREFSQPAAHRLGTETSIIDGEIRLYCEPELKKIQEILLKKHHKSVHEIKKSLNVIKGSVHRLRQATRDYQQLTPEPEKPEEFYIDELINKIVKRNKRGVRFLTVDTKNIKDKHIKIRACKNRLEYVFEELLLNARKELDEKRVPKMRIRIDLLKQKENVLIKISDSGLGIPENILSKLFKAPVKGRPGGTGLGMFLISRFLKENGGRIELSYEKPENYPGASFLIILPIDPYKF